MREQIKPGDVVECVSRAPASCLVVGRKYTVTKATITSAGDVVVWLDNHVATYSDRLKKVG